MHLKNDTYIQQSRFANYCRTGELKEIKGLKENRVHHCRRLVYNVIDDTLQSAFPITYNLLSEEEWEFIVNKFFSEHSCESHVVWKMPFEFYKFIKASGTDLKLKYEFIEDLLLFEWTEVEIYMMQDIEYPEVKKVGDLIKEIVVFSPEFKILALDFPVHLVNSKLLKNENRGAYYVLIFRERSTGNVRFINLSFYFAWLIDKISTENKSLYEIFGEAKIIFNINVEDQRLNTVQFMENLEEQKFLIGYKK